MDTLANLHLIHTLSQGHSQMYAPYLVTVLTSDGRGWAIECPTETSAMVYAQEVMQIDDKATNVAVMKLTPGKCYHLVKHYHHD
jgi:hypothetical protein